MLWLYVCTYMHTSLERKFELSYSETDLLRFAESI